MEIKEFDGTLSEESKKALQSETWQKVGDGMKEKMEVKHFTAENTAENVYGWTWDQVVKEYLRSGYDAADNSPDIVVMGTTYKTLRRPEVTVFYDAAGATLFDVTNERLEKEYEWLMNCSVKDSAENMDIGEDAKGDTEPQSLETAESKEFNAQNSRSAKQRAEEKLKREMETVKDKVFADLIISYLLKRCEEDEGMAEDVVQEHKTWQKCFDYIYRQARQQAHGNCAAVRDDVVYEWAEDYYHKDDKAEEEKKAKKAEGEKVKKAKPAADKKAAITKSSTNKADKAPAVQKSEVQKETPKFKKNKKDMDGQLDIFAMMGM